MSQFRPGQRVKIRSTGRIGTIIELMGDRLVKVAGDTGDSSFERPENLEPAVKDPDEALRYGLVADSPEAFLLQDEAAYLKWAHQYDPSYGLSNARIEPLLYQVYAAKRVIDKSQPRMILADEVGLGKTIEAGLIIRELRARGVMERVLIVVPASLVTQWQAELRTKFNEEAVIYDGPYVRRLSAEDPNRNPWRVHDSIVTSLSLARREENSKLIGEAGWDMVLFDEAHHVRRKWEGGKGVRTKAYVLAENLLDQTDGLLLLTATPMQLHPYEFYALTVLVEPGLFESYGDFKREKKRIPQLNEAFRALENYPLSTMSRPLPAVLREQLGGSSDYYAGVVEDEGSRRGLMEQIAREHRLSQVMIRNRKAVLGEAPRRRPQTLRFQMSPDERELYDDLSAYIRDIYGRAQGSGDRFLGFLMTTYRKLLSSSSYALGKALGRRADKLQAELAELTSRSLRLSDIWDDESLDEETAEEISDVLGLLEDYEIDWKREAIEEEIVHLKSLRERAEYMRDSKVQTLVQAVRDILGADPEEKVLVFTQFIETQSYLAGILGDEFSVATFNGRMSQEEKDKQFKLFKSSVSILISTESGGEGRNFQFAHILINYDLPWNPMKIEQRIGRLDRIGQTKEVYVYNFSLEDSVEDRVLELVQNRIGLFEETIGGLDPIIGDLETEIEKVVFSPPGEYEHNMHLLEDTVEIKVAHARQREREFSDFILDARSFRKDEANRLLGHEPAATFEDLEDFSRKLILHFSEAGAKRASISGPRGGLLNIDLPGALRRYGLNPTYNGTFNPKIALQEETLDFFAFGHPLVDAMCQHATSDLFCPYAAVLEYDGRNLAGFTGVRFLFELTVQSSLGSTKRLLEAWIDTAGEPRVVRDAREAPQNGWSLHDEAVILQSSSTQVQSSILAEIFNVALQLAWEACHQDTEEQKEGWHRLQEEERGRLARLRDFKMHKWTEELRRQEEILERMEASERPEDKKVIPAREGLVRRAEEHLRLADEEYERAVHHLDDKGLPEPSVRLVSAAWLCPHREDLERISE